MKKLNAPKQEADLIANDIFSPSEFEETFAEGYYGAQDPQGGDEKQLLGSLLMSLRKHWLLILSLNFIVTAATVVYVAQKPDYYTAQARVQINAEVNPAAGDGKGSIIVNNSGADPAYFATQLQIVESSGLLRRVVKTLDLEHNQSFRNPRKERQLTVWQNVQKMFGLYQPPVQAAEAPDAKVVAVEKTGTEKTGTENDLSLNKTNEASDDTEALAPFVGKLKGSLTVNPVKDFRTMVRETRLIAVEYTHEDPAVAAKVVNTIADVYVLQNLETKVLSNASAGDFLQKRVAELQSQIRQGEERLLNYSKSNQIVSLDADQNTVVKRFADLNQQLGLTQNERIAAQASYQAALQNQMRTATVENQDTQVTGLEARLNEQKQRLAQLKLDYTDEWHEVVQTRKNIELIENQLLQVRKRASDIQLATLQERLNTIATRERELRDALEKQRAEVIRQNEASINYRIIQQEIDTNKTLLAGLLQRSKENDVILAGTPNNVLVADRAATPRIPVGPQRTRNVGIAFLVSLGLGIMLAFLLDWLNDSIHYSKEIESSLGLPLLAAIPAAPVSLSKRLMPARLSLPGKRKRTANSYNLSVFEKPAFMEAYLQLRTYLMLSTAGGPPKTILIASGEEGEGKTTTAIKLAESLAKTSSKKVLLIDADLRCPRIHLVKGIDNEGGLTTLLTSKNIDDNLLIKTIKSDENSGIDILTAGERTANPANLLSSEQMYALINTLSLKYSHIVIDSPPVLYFADTVILSSLVDAVIIVVRDNFSSRQTVLKAKKMLQNIGAKIVGMVVNGVPLAWTNYYKYKDYDSHNELPAGNGNGQGLLKLN